MVTAAEFLEAGLPRLGVFFHVNLPTLPNIRLWLGVGDIQPGINVLDPNPGTTYRGLGELLDVPAFSHLFDGTADRVDFGIAGMPQSVLSEIAANLMAAQLEIQGQAVYVGWAPMDYQWQLAEAIHWEWSGFADLIHVRHVGAADAFAPVGVTLSLSCGDWMTGRRRAGLSYYTDTDQKRRAAILNPAAVPDQFCSRAGNYNHGVEKNWPPA